MQTPYDPPATGRYAPTTWGGSPYTEITVPSGQLCLVRKLQPMDLVSGDLLGVSDLLTDTVQAKIDEAKTGPRDHKKPAAEQEKADRDKIADALGKVVSSPENFDSMIDAVMIKAVVEPSIEIPPRDFSERIDGTVYVDTISFGDKMHIFNWVMGGMDQLKSFREPTSSDVATLESVEDVRHSTE